MPYKDREKQRKAQRESVKRRREKVNATIRAQRRALRAFVDATKKGKPCVDCAGTFPPYCMDYHHLRDKSFELSRAVNSRYTEASILAEIDKCVLVCANCHRIRHATVL